MINPDLKRELDKLDGGPAAGRAETQVASLSAPAKKEELVAPPDFSELRKTMAPEPSRKFVPPPDGDVAAEANHCEEAGDGQRS